MALFLFAFLLPVAATAQEEISVRDLRVGFESKYKNELVSIRGWVATERRVSSRTYRGFFLRDRFGDMILVRTVDPLPQITSEILVSGVALRDADTNDIYLSERRRDSAPLAGGAPDAAQQAAAAAHGAEQERRRLQEEENRKRTEEEASSRQTMMLIGIGGAVILLVALAVILMRRKPEPEVPFVPSPEPTQTPGLSPSPGDDAFKTVRTRPAQADGPSVDDYKTVRVYKTTKVLPGRLIVMEGGVETDTILLSDQTGRGEIEIGRDSPDVSGGIRIKDRTNTLSRKQARLVFSSANRTFDLVNLAGDSANPTSVNGREMRLNESVTLADGDLLRMGNLELKFRAR